MGARIETNLRLVKPGWGIEVPVRYLTTTAALPVADRLEKACGYLQRRFQLAAVRIPGDKQTPLMIASVRPMREAKIEAGNWEIILRDVGGPTAYLNLQNAMAREVLPMLLERALLIQIGARTERWTLDSPRIWYSPQPFEKRDGILAYRRISLSALLIDRMGIGIAADIETAFFSENPLSWFFNPALSRTERNERKHLFNRLSARQEQQKGTLVYDNGRGFTKCYFVEAPEGLTCGGAGPLRVDGTSYESLYAYYKAKNPVMDVQPSTPAIYVSFDGGKIRDPQPVAADRVRVRVFNDALPEPLQHLAAMEPARRRREIASFWNELGESPFGNLGLELEAGFWQPEHERVWRIPLPDLKYKNETLHNPRDARPQEKKAYYRDRLSAMKAGGAYSVPITVPRKIHGAYPQVIGENVAKRLMEELCDLLADWTAVPFTFELTPYERLEAGIRELNGKDRAGVSLFVLGREPSAYFDVAFGLSRWRIKRVTAALLQKKYRALQEGEWDRRIRAMSFEKGERTWRQFVYMTALDLLQKLDVIPWRTVGCNPYEVQMVIDVGRDRRHFALAALVDRDTAKNPAFEVWSEVMTKADHQHEGINPEILADAIVDFFKGHLPRQYQPFTSLLILRDGRLCGEELKRGIDEAIPRLVEQKVLASNPRVEVVELHKESQKPVRLWSIRDEGTVDNVLEGTAVEISRSMVVLATTGCLTLHQGTADPLTLIGVGRDRSLRDAASACVTAAQLNWSNPLVAQRLPLHVKRADDDLVSRMQQEIRRAR